jgi:DNA (cytosine-5)-methyltransferase 1
MGFDARWGVLGAADVGAPHQRDRIWIKARQRNILLHAEHDRNGWWQQQSESVKQTQGNVANTENIKRRARQLSKQNQAIRTQRNNQLTRGGENVANSTSIGLSGQRKLGQPINSKAFGNRKTSQSVNVRKCYFWAIEPDVGRVVDGVAARVDRLKAIGNGQVPEVARKAWEQLNESRQEN